MPDPWLPFDSGWPPEKSPVLLLMPGHFVPLVGYWKTGSEGRYWVVPGVGNGWGAPEWWCPVPRPYPVDQVEEFHTRNAR